MRNIDSKAENVHIFFNNNRSNYAPKSAEQMQRILEIIALPYTETNRAEILFVPTVSCLTVSQSFNLLV